MSAIRLVVAVVLGVSLYAGAQTPTPGAPPAAAGGAVKAFDTNGDGVLSESEKAAALKALEQKHPQLMKMFDKDGDGTLTPREKIGAAKLLQEWKAKQAGAGAATPAP